MSTALVVEDSLTQREIIRVLLEQIGLKVIFAVNGVEALSLVETHCPNVVILDIVMPKMNGYEVCRRIKGNVKTQKLAVVMYSTKSEKCDFYWGSKQGADAYVSKQYHLQALVDTVKQLLLKTNTAQKVGLESRDKEQSELIAQIKRLYANLRVYKKALKESPAWLEGKDLTSAARAIEAEIDSLEAQLDAFAYREETRPAWQK
jgi:twitching motility two-component system response regulator PilH